MAVLSQLTAVVAVALVREDRHVLMQRRRVGAHHGGLWEFPGGKREPGEALEVAAVREMMEELAVEIDPRDLAPVSFASDMLGHGAVPGGGIVLLLFACRRWRGDPECRDAEALGWFGSREIAGLDMPPLDVPLADALARFLAGAAPGFVPTATHSPLAKPKRSP